MNKEIEFVADRLDYYVERAMKDKPIAHLGLPSLDELIGGVRRGCFTCIAGEPGAGKTTLTNQIADDLAAQGHKALVFSYEMTKQRLVASSIVRSSSDLTLDDIAGADPGPARKQAIDRAVERFRGSVAPNLCYIDYPCSSIEIGALVGKCEREFGKKPIVFVDYLQLMPSAADRPPAEERMQVKEAAAGLRRIANSYNIPVFAISSINRANYSKPACGLESLGASSAIEYGCDIVLTLSVAGKGGERAENLAKRKRPVVTALIKNRYGAIGSTNLVFDTARARFEEE